jgi:hypothetical protein
MNISTEPRERTVTGGKMKFRDQHGRQREDHLRILWADACSPLGCEPLAAGWVLPGGMRTTDKDVAMRCTEDIARRLAGY